MRILIAEDQKDLNKILVKKLTAEGYSVDNCFDGQEALDFLDMASYDGVILDIMMPKLDGLSVIKHMRAKGDHTPVLFLTARDSIDDKVTGLDLGANDY
ncbi:MAG: response regulator, partial [Firmicutes bacterium]|nr:response regulator [Bacillota bacterium]